MGAETVISLVALILSIYSAYTAERYNKQAVIRERKQATLQAYNALQEQCLDELNQYTTEQIQQLDTSSVEYKRLISCVARVEHFCVGINQGIYDQDVLFEMAAGYLDGRVYKLIEPIIARRNSNGKRCEGKDFYQNYHKVVQWMKEERKIRSQEQNEKA